MKKALKILLAILITPIALFVLLVALLYLPPVQKWSVDKATAYANESTGMKISIESVRLSFPLDLDLRGFQALQPNDSLTAQADTVAKVESLVCSVEFWPLLDGKVNVDRLDFNNLKVNTLDIIPSAQVKGTVGRLSVVSRGIDIPQSHVKVDEGTLQNAQLDIALSDTVPEDTTTSENFWQIDINKLQIDKSQLTLHMPGDTMSVGAYFDEAVAKQTYLGLHDNVYRVGALDWKNGSLQYDQNFVKPSEGFDSNHLLLSQLNIGIDSLSYGAPNLGMTLRACNFTEKSGLKIDDFTGRFAMDSLKIALLALHVRMPATDFSGALTMDMNAFDEQKPGKIFAQLKGYTSLADYQPLLTALPKEYARILPNNRINLSGTLEGNMQQALLKDVSIEWEKLLTLKANGKVGNLLDTDALFADVRLNGELKNLSFIRPLLPKDVDNMVRLPQNIGFAYDINLRNGRYALSGVTSQGGGSIQTKGYFDSHSTAYQLSATAKQLPLEHFLPNMGLHPFTGTLSLSGKGTDIMNGRSAIVLNSDIKAFRYQGYTLDNVKATATLIGQNIDAHVSANNPMLAGTLTATGKLSSSFVDLLLKGHIGHADLHTLAQLDQRWTMAGDVDLHVTSDMNKRHTASGSLDNLLLTEGKSTLVKGSFDLDGAMNGKKLTAHLDGTLNEAQLQALGAMDAPACVSTTASLDVQTDFGDFYDVQGHVGNFLFADNEESFDMGDVDVDILSRSDTTRAMISGGDFLLDAAAHGSYNTVLAAFSNIGTQLSNQLKNKAIDHVAIREQLPTASLTLHTGTQNFFSRFARKQGYAFRNADVNLTSSLETGLNGTAMVDSLVYRDSLTIDHADLALTTEGEELTYKIAVENQKTNDYPYKAYLNGLVLANGLQAQATILDKDDKTGLDIGLEAIMKGEGINVSITSPRSVIGYKEFAVNNGNYVFVGQNRRVSARMRLQADDGAGVQIYSNDEDSVALQDITLSMNNFELEKLFSVLPFMPEMSGVLNGDYHVMQTADELTVSSDMTIDNMVYEQCAMGNIGTNLVYIPKGDGTHYVDAIISKDDYEVGQLTGTYDPAGQGVLDAAFKLDKFPLNFVNGFIPDKIIGLRGMGDGELTVRGPLNKLDINGEVYVDSSYLYSEPYGIEMRFDNDPVTIQNSRLLFENFNMYANNDQPLSLYGYLDFKNLDDMQLNLRMRAENFELIDAKENARSEAYGKAFVNFFGAMVGPVSQLKMGGRLEVLGTTDMTYVMKESALSTDDQLDELVHFTDFTDSTSTQIVRPTPQGFQMDMSIAIDEQAHIVCALNEAHTNFIDLIGGGDLTMHYDEANSLSLNGRYTLNSGQMKYSLDMIPLRTFNIQEGSFIEFTGDPMNPTLSITATENIKANYSGGLNDRIVNFTAGVNMTNSLSNPTIEFIVDAPDDLDAQNNLNTMSTEEKAKIAVTLLASGMYLADGSGNNFAMNSALASFMQSKINDISGRALGSMGLDLTANMESTTDATGALHTDYTFNFSKRLWNNRLTINMGGRVSTGSEATEDNGAYFDSFSMQYRLNKNETQYLKLYYEREAYDWLEGQLSEFGAGFLWKRKLQHFKDIFRWKSHDEDSPKPRAPKDGHGIQKDALTAPKDSLNTTKKENDEE